MGEVFSKTIELTPNRPLEFGVNFIFFIIVKSYCYLILLYSSSLTASSHSLELFSPGISKAR